MKAQGVNILIALGHSGYTEDKRIAMEVPDIDVVVGGHSNTFLYSGEKPSKEAIEGPYPTLITQPGLKAKVVPVVQAYAYTKYLGYLKLDFDDNGDLTHHEGQPILLSQDYPEGNVYLEKITYNISFYLFISDQSILEELKPFQKELQALSKSYFCIPDLPM